jgi:hypothetical protein
MHGLRLDGCRATPVIRCVSTIRERSFECGCCSCECRPCTDTSIASMPCSKKALVRFELERVLHHSGAIGDHAVVRDDG